MDSLVHEGIGERWDRFTQLFQHNIPIVPCYGMHNEWPLV